MKILKTGLYQCGPSLERQAERQRDRQRKRQTDRQKNKIDKSGLRERNGDIQIWQSIVVFPLCKSNEVNEVKKVNCYLFMQGKVTNQHILQQKILFYIQIIRSRNCQLTYFALKSNFEYKYWEKKISYTTPNCFV